MKFKSQKLDKPFDSATRAEIEATTAQLEAEIPNIKTTGVSLPFHETLALMSLMASLREVRQKLGLSLDEVAVRSGIDKSYLSRLETNRQENVTLSTIDKIARALKMQVRLVLVDADDATAV